MELQQLMPINPQENHFEKCHFDKELQKMKMSRNIRFHQNVALVSPGTVRKLRPCQIQIALTCDSGEVQRTVKAQFEAYYV